MNKKVTLYPEEMDVCRMRFNADGFAGIQGSDGKVTHVVYREAGIKQASYYIGFTNLLAPSPGKEYYVKFKNARVVMRRYPLPENTPVKDTDYGCFIGPLDNRQATIVNRIILISDLKKGIEDEQQYLAERLSATLRPNIQARALNKGSAPS